MGYAAWILDKYGDWSMALENQGNAQTKSGINVLIFWWKLQSKEMNRLPYLLVRFFLLENTWKKNHNNMKRGICILDLIHEDKDPLKREGIVMNPV